MFLYFWRPYSVVQLNLIKNISFTKIISLKKRFNNKHFIVAFRLSDIYL
jgi:hypothetical protein